MLQQFSTKNSVLLCMSSGASFLYIRSAVGGCRWDAIYNYVLVRIKGTLVVVKIGRMWELFHAVVEGRIKYVQHSFAILVT